MVTCYLRYTIDPYKLKEFEHYTTSWIPLIEKFGGKHHGVFMPSEGVTNVALTLFSFPSLALYEEYRMKSFQDPDCQVLFRYAEETRCFLSAERSFFRPVFGTGGSAPCDLAEQADINPDYVGLPGSHSRK